MPWGHLPGCPRAWAAASTGAVPSVVAAAGDALWRLDPAADDPDAPWTVTATAALPAGHTATSIAVLPSSLVRSKAGIAAVAVMGLKSSSTQRRSFTSPGSGQRGGTAAWVERLCPVAQAAAVRTPAPAAAAAAEPVALVGTAAGGLLMWTPGAAPVPVPWIDLHVRHTHTHTHTQGASMRCAAMLLGSPQCRGH